jgi:putative redox protein
MTTAITARVDLARLAVEATGSAGEAVVMVADPPDGSGRGAGPKEVVLSALAACTGMDVASILRKKRQRAERYEIAVRAESAVEHPRVFTSIMVEHRVSGEVEPEALRRSIELSATRYCPVNAMLSAVARVEHRYLLHDAAGATHEATVAVVGPERVVRDLRDA